LGEKRDMKAAYKQRYDKLTYTLAIPVDQKMKSIADEAKRRKFKFNEWARDILYARMQDLVEAVETDDDEK
jgi:hypothetical protein